MRVLIIYHRVDYDGIFSALIAKKFYTQNGDTVELLGYNYGDKLEKSIEELILMYDEICMVDISFDNVDTMKALYESKKSILLDHHETCLKVLEDNGMTDWEGHREIGIGACEITWNYFYKSVAIPELIRRLSLYDVWNHDVLDWDIDVIPVQYALRTSYGMSFDKIWADRHILLDDKELTWLLEDGQYLLKYLRTTWQGWVKNYSFEVTVAGQFKGICMLTPQFGSLPFESIPEISDMYQVFVCANLKDGGKKYSLSLYSTPEKIGDFSLGAYVKKITQTGVGGGHACACGMELTEEQFTNLIKNREI